MGDAFCAAFPTAQQALSAALSAQHELEVEQWAAEIAPVRVRMALHTGPGEIRDGDYVGPHLNRIARLLSTGYGGQVLLSQTTYNLVCDTLPATLTLLDLGEHRLKDLTRPEHVYQVAPRGLPSHFPPLKSVDNRPNNLPRQATALIGREKEIEAVCALVRRPEVAVVTLTGPGGTGKTRLGLQVAADLLDDFSDGVWFVDLAEVTDSSLLVPTIATVLGVKESTDRPMLDTLISYLSDKQMLLVLDNFEQLVSDSTEVSQFLRSCPRLKVLVTSRLPLRVSGEHEYPVPPMALPDPDNLPNLERLTQYEAVRLFIERAVAIRPDFEVTNDNAPAVAEICARLDGLPLAIELAAARIRLFPPQALLARLSSRLKVLTGGGRDLPARQQTLRGAIEWSYDLLVDGEKHLFRRVAVFNGGRTFEALEAVCNFDGRLEIDVLDGIEGLVSKSLLQQREGRRGEARFWMLETIHEYAREKLIESGEIAKLQRVHLAYYLTLAEEAEPHLTGGAGQMEWLGRLEDDYDNIRAALQWAREEGEREDAERGLRLAAAMWRFWGVLGKYREGREQLEGALSSVPDSPQDATGVARAKGRALYAVAAITHNQGDLSLARVNAEQALEMARQAGDKMQVVASLDFLAMLAAMAGDYASERSLHERSLRVLTEIEDKPSRAVALENMGRTAHAHENYDSARLLFEQSLALAKEVGNRSLVASLLGELGAVAFEQGDYTSARSLREESLDVLRETGDKTGLAYGLYFLGLVADAQGDYSSARSHFTQGLQMNREAEDTLGVAMCLAGLGDWPGVRKDQGQAERERALRLLAAATALFDTIGNVLRPRDRLRYEHGLSVARGELGDELFEKVWAEGRAMSMEQAIEYALEDSLS
jgi:predicted ATPase